MEQYIPKSVLAAELKKRFDYRVEGLKAINNGTYWKEGQSENEFNAVLTRCAYNAAKNEVFELMCFLDTLEVKEVQEELVSDGLLDMSKADCKIQYANIESGIHAHAEDYSFNIESELFNQLTKEQQALWRKEIEQACISGGYNGLYLAKDPRYEENLKVKEVGINKEISRFIDTNFEKATIGHKLSLRRTAKHFFELGLNAAQKREEV